MNDRLTSQHISALFALLGVGREISNTELDELAGFRIDGQVRKTLNDRHLVVSTRRGNQPFVHALTEAGQKRCEAELAGERPERAGHVGGAFYLVLDGLSRYLERENLALADLFGQKNTHRQKNPERAPASASSVGEVYRRLADKQGDWVRLTDLRAELAGSRAEVDQVLKAMSKSGLAHLAPDPDRKSLTAADREAAIRIGGEDNHLLVVERS